MSWFILGFSLDFIYSVDLTDVIRGASPGGDGDKNSHLPYKET